MIIANDVPERKLDLTAIQRSFNLYEDGKAVHFTRDTKRNLADSILTEIAKISGSAPIQGRYFWKGKEPGCTHG